MKRSGRILVIFLAAAALMLAALPACAGDPLPPSPEPPAARPEARPTPAPTAEPKTITDHINHPDDTPKFAFQKGKKLLDIWFPNIKDADAAVLIYDGTVYMIDCGDEKMGARAAEMLRWLGVEQVDVLFNSHLHHDHTDGLAAVADAAKIKKIRICFDTSLTESGVRMAETAKERGITVSKFKDGSTYAMGDGAVQLRFMKNNENGLDMNNQSAVTMVTYGKRKILFLADMERPGQQAMMKRVDAKDLKCDIIKYPHHGKADMLTQFYEVCAAKLAVVTSVEGRADAGQKSIRARKFPAVYTYRPGYYTHLATDGKYWLVEYVPMRDK